MEARARCLCTLQAIAAAVVAALVSPAFATPDKLDGIARSQIETFTPDTQKLLRIWLINIGQGDSILIEMPPAISQAMGNPAEDPVNILVDGGGKPKSDADRARLFLRELYKPQLPTIEYMILTHHDQDHIAGLTEVLRDEDIAVKRLYFSGLAAFRKGIQNFIPSNPGTGFVVGGNRVLGRFDSAKDLEDRYILKSKTDLEKALNGKRLITEFEAFADAAAKKPVESFNQACFDCTDLDDRLARAKTSTTPAFNVQTLWPWPKPRRYGG